MSSVKLAKRFPAVLDKAKFLTKDQIVSIQNVQAGQHIILGRSIKNDDYSNLIYLGKVTEQAQGKSYFANNLWMDVSFPHVAYITGTRGSGKSFDLGVILEGLSELANDSNVKNSVTPITSILIDTQSQFWTLKYKPNKNIPENLDQINDLRSWGMEPSSVENCSIFIPKGTEGITGDEIEFTIKASQITHEEWCGLLGQEVYSPQGHIIGRTLEHFAESEFSIEQMVGYIEDPENWEHVAEQSRNALLYKLDDYRRSNLFSNDGLNIRDILIEGHCNVFMLRDLRNEDKSLITSIISRQLFSIMGEYHRKKKVNTFFEREEDLGNLPSKVWLVIDEAHVVAPKDSYSPARSALVEYVKRGRDAGLSLVLATQQPSAVDDKILSQVDFTINHRLTFQSDVEAAMGRTPTKIIQNLKIGGTEISDFRDMIRLLDSGECFIGDHNTSRVILSKIRPRLSSHGGYSPK